MADALSTHGQLVRALADARRSAGEATELIETHISSVLLAGAFAYKLKKPLDLGFLDFRALADREHYCHEEIRLNRRLAPSIYLDVVAITGSPAAPAIGGDGPPIDFAVRMHRFDQDAMLTRFAADDALDPAWFEALAERVADFHAAAASVAADAPFGAVERIAGPMRDNVTHLRGPIESAERRVQLDRIGAWTDRELERLAPVLARRRGEGHVRECHGDMHLGNMVLVDGAIEVFDGIEFNEDFRWIDVQSEIAFLTMDLDHRSAGALGWRFLNAYLARSGDYEGLSIHRLYQTYRAMVRAKVDGIRLGQEGLADHEREAILADCGVLLDLAASYGRPTAPALFLTCGLSGSGKTTLARARAAERSLIHLRSDVERKRLHGLGALDRSDSAIGGGIYTPDATRRTYERLAALARTVLAAGYSVVVDATFLTRDERRPFLTLAAEAGVEATIWHCDVPRDELERRLAARQDDASEADVRVLDHQLARFEPPGTDEPVEPIPRRGSR